ncbi:MAG TPA: Flp pilus assembly protein CpaB [Candidatus Acidoferrales bacterium]|jgi:pilus assembly protein CpaB|nr:Flp pilus assembly protein CpaB [Candidatus Acidoferrales bacterium]
MNRNRMLIGLGVALLVALLVSNFVYRKFQQASAVKSTPMSQIVVAAKSLPLGTRLEPSLVRTISWPANQSATGMCTRLQDCVNRALIMPVAENEPIMQSKLAPIAAGAGLAAAIPPGMRAMSVAVNDVVGVAGFVTPGTMVDVLVTGAVAAGQGGQNITRTILENVRVLAAGQKVQQQDQEGKPQTVSVITLLVSPDDAAKLAMGSTQGKIQLALRNTIDTDDTMPPAVLQTSLFSSGEPVATPLVAKHVAPAKPAKPDAPAAYQVEIISGNKRETKSFTEQ